MFLLLYLSLFSSLAGYLLARLFSPRFTLLTPALSFNAEVKKNPGTATPFA